jgi:integrase
VSTTSKFQPRQLPNKTWLVEVIPALSPKGRRERRYFPTRSAALAFAEELKTRRDNLAFRPELSAAQLVEAETAFKLLGERTDLRLPDVVASYLATEARQQESVTLHKLFEEYKAARTHTSRAHLRRINLTIERVAPLLDRMVCDIRRHEVLACTETLTPGTRAQDMANLRAVLNFGHEAGYLEVVPLRRMDTPQRGRSSGEVVLMAPTEVRRILEVTLAYVPDMLPFLVAQVFCGVRTAEVCRLSWADVDLVRKRLTIRAAVSKTKTGRTIALMPVCVAWFQAYIEAGHPHTGPFTNLTENTAKQRMSPLHRLLGYKGPRDRTPDRQIWKQGILRDSFASYSFAYHDSIDRLTKEMGHTSFSMTRNHYLGVATLEAAEEFFNIFPTKGDKIVSMPVASA